MEKEENQFQEKIDDLNRIAVLASIFSLLAEWDFLDKKSAGTGPSTSGNPTSVGGPIPPDTKNVP